MAKDDRLYGKFTLDFADSPKIMPLSDAAFRCLVEATLYSRRMLTDGFIAERVAVKLWGQEVLDELSSNDELRPSFIRADGGYRIHDFDDHQDTRADVEARRKRNAENGRRGGLARARRMGGEVLGGLPGDSSSTVPGYSLSDSSSAASSKTQAETETETETETEATPFGEGGRARPRGARIDGGFRLTAPMRAWAADHAPQVDIDRALPEFIDYWAAVPGEKGVKLDWVATWRNSMRKQQLFALRDGVRPISAPPRQELRPEDCRHKFLGGACVHCGALDEPAGRLPVAIDSRRKRV